MVFLHEMDGTTGLIDPVAVADRGKDLQDAYKAAQPFAHAVIDDFLPEELVDVCLAEFARRDALESVSFDRAQERLKRAYSPESMSAPLRNLFHSLNSAPFLKVMENITGITGLLPDPYFAGGGFHETGTGGHLSVHADFNYHKQLGVERRINILIYLNKDWDENCGGQLELWDREMKTAVQTVVPVANRCVIFSTDSYSYHGHSQPVNHPQGQSRKSLALYYYTATWSDAKRKHTTLFKPRPASADKADWQVKRQELIDDLLPPLLKRGVARLLGKGGAAE